MDLPNAPLPNPYPDWATQAAQKAKGALFPKVTPPSGPLEQTTGPQDLHALLSGAVPWPSPDMPLGAPAAKGIAGLRALINGTPMQEEEQKYAQGYEKPSVMDPKLGIMMQTPGSGLSPANEPMVANPLTDINAYKVKELFRRAMEAEKEAGPGITPSVDFSPANLDAIATQEAHKLPPANQPMPPLPPDPNKGSMMDALMNIIKNNPAPKE